jgi:hypothetical protein
MVLCARLPFIFCFSVLRLPLFFHPQQPSLTTFSPALSPPLFFERLLQRNASFVYLHQLSRSRHSWWQGHCRPGQSVLPHQAWHCPCYSTLSPLPVVLSDNWYRCHGTCTLRRYKQSCRQAHPRSGSRVDTPRCTPSQTPQKAQQDLVPALTLAVIHGIRDCKQLSFNT